ncbi:concanavalin A-like lectin/glucanase domain-containing protein [Diplogelasinospora grovesii]|uniref:Concanavalin A-like lectin/glucanase domain-containing protein n=1 Tax=Diplogelasinospora grovesii TaxID=303347 RepID=A0AAN6NBX8_9PEZI|nr:concanavalin A-like lectin/glucanase domain-containing protein [Diplogelasinospora grovesii]
MKHFQAALLSALALTQAVLAEFSYTIEATHNGVPIPQDQIKLEAHEPTTDILNRTWAPSPPSSKPPSRTGKRSNPVSISANWCGAVKHTNSSNQIKIVHGYFQHPTCSLRSGVTSYPQYAAPWVGIDGDTWTSAILQSGTVCTVSSAGAVSNSAWFQWFPSAAVTISSMPVNAGDWFEVTVNTTSNTAGKVTITNVSQGVTYTATLTGGATLGRLDADWVLEDPVSSSGQVPFASFTETWFESAYATTTSGASLGIDGATMYQIGSSGTCQSAEYDNADLYVWSN